jgi:hypothetical protein
MFPHTFMRFPRLCLTLILAAVVLSLQAAPSPAPARWSSISVESMKTSIYVGNVTLTTSELRREGDRYTATYDARVWPWAFWNENGRLTIQFSDADVERLHRGERVEFTGDATNHKNKPRHISGRAERVDATNGKIKVRIGVDDIELIFNGGFRAS